MPLIGCSLAGKGHITDDHASLFSCVPFVALLTQADCTWRISGRKHHTTVHDSAVNQTVSSCTIRSGSGKGETSVCTSHLLYSDISEVEGSIVGVCCACLFSQIGPGHTAESCGNLNLILISYQIWISCRDRIWLRIKVSCTGQFWRHWNSKGIF